MPKLERWIIASKMVEVLDRDTMMAVLRLGGQIGGGWCEIHQHVCVNQNNKEQIEDLLRSGGFTVTSVSDRQVAHPECHAHETHIVDH